jgi:hypothetical protein
MILGMAGGVGKRGFVITGNCEISESRARLKSAWQEISATGKPGA